MTRKIFTGLFAAFILLSCSTFGNNKAENDTMTNQNKNDAQSKELFAAIEKNDIEKVRAILQQKPNFEVRNAKKQTPLMAATYKFYNDIAFLLIDAGASVNAKDDMQNTPFLYAGAEGNLELVKKALKHGADFTIFNRYGGSALIPAAEKGHPEVVKLLVNTPGYPIDHVNNLGWTALLEAVILGTGGDVHTQIVQILVDGGVDINIPDKNGVTSLQHAEKKGFKNIISILKKESSQKKIKKTNL